MVDLDDQLLETFLEPVRKCALYKPAFGKGKNGGMSYSGFQSLYGGDSFYAWLGLNDRLVYTAHKTAGGLTSVYRQIGIGSERLFRSILGFSLGLDEPQLNWSYEYQKPDGKFGTHTLDASIKLDDLNTTTASRIQKWLIQSKGSVGTSSSGTISLGGVVFEVRQGYKSADSKRQNADLRYGVRAYQAGLLPAFVIMSTQVSEPVLRRYRADGMLVLTGVLDEDPTISTFAFFKQVIQFDLEGFFVRNTERIQNEIKQIIEQLMSP